MSDYNTILIINIEMLSLKEWSFPDCGGIPEQVSCFVDVNEVYKKSFPIKTKYVSLKRLSNPWISSAIMKSIKTKSYYFKLNKLGLLSDDFNKRYKNNLTSIIRKAKQLYIF